MIQPLALKRFIANGAARLPGKLIRFVCDREARKKANTEVVLERIRQKGQWLQQLKQCSNSDFEKNKQFLLTNLPTDGLFDVIRERMVLQEIWTQEQYDEWKQLNRK